MSWGLHRAAPAPFSSTRDSAARKGKRSKKKSPELFEKTNHQLNFKPSSPLAAPIYL
jgi:hypothetical protein